MFKQIKSRILPNESIKNNICNTFTLIAPKSANGNHIVSKPKILPAPVKPTLNTISFKTNSSINNNCKYYYWQYLKKCSKYVCFTLIFCFIY